MSDFPQLEKYYETRLFAMFLKEEEMAKTLYLSQPSFPTKICMNIYENHLSLITDIKMYSRQHICDVFSVKRCLQKCLITYNINPNCDATVKYVFPGGVYKNKLSVFEELE